MSKIVWIVLKVPLIFLNEYYNNTTFLSSKERTYDSREAIPQCLFVNITIYIFHPNYAKKKFLSIGRTLQPIRYAESLEMVLYCYNDRDSRIN